MKYLFSLLFSLCATLLSAQKLTVSGTVKDEKGALPGTSIFIGESSKGTVTDDQGNFTLSNLNPGKYTILARMIGYLPYYQMVILNEKSQHLEIQLKDNPTLLQEVGIQKKDKNRGWYLTLFKKFFIGSSANAEECTLLNPDVLITTFNPKEKILKVKAKDFIEIENKALGYKITYLLNAFELDLANNYVYYEGVPKYETLDGRKAQLARWEKKRHKAYFGSKLDFFRSLYSGTAYKDGYEIFKIEQKENPNRKPEDLIEKMVNKYSSPARGMLALTFDSRDSLAYWLRERAKQKILQIVNTNRLLLDTLVKSDTSHLKSINFTDDLCIVYKADQPKDIGFDSYKISLGQIKYMGRQTTKLKSADPLCFYENGNITNPRNIWIEGYWSFLKIADSLPFDFVPTLARE